MTATHAFVGWRDGEIVMFWQDDGSCTGWVMELMRSMSTTIQRLPLDEALATIDGKRKS